MRSKLNKKQIFLIVVGSIVLIAGVGEFDFFLIAVSLILFICAYNLRTKSDIKNAVFTPSSPKHTESHVPPASLSSSDDEHKNTFFTHKCKDTQKNIAKIKEKFIVIDTETTGLNSANDKLVSIAAIRFYDGVPINRFHTYINPMIPIPSSSTKINGITNEMVATAPKELEACILLYNFLNEAIDGSTIIVAYNSSFDMRFIENAMNRHGIHCNIRHFDVLGFTKRRILNLKNYKQVTVAQHLCIDSSGAHNALRDCEMCADILLTLLDK